MYRVALNIAMSQMRRVTAPTQLIEPLSEVHLDIDGQSDDPADSRLDVLRELMDGLEPLNRTLLMLYPGDRNCTEIAEIAGLTETNVATRLSRIRGMAATYRSFGWPPS